MAIDEEDLLFGSDAASSRFEKVLAMHALESLEISQDTLCETAALGGISVWTDVVATQSGPSFPRQRKDVV